MIQPNLLPAQAPANALPLRPYQSDAIDAMRQAARRGITRQVCVLPTGAGKTFVAATMIHKVAQAGWKVLFMVHRDELVSQTRDALGIVSPDLSVGLVKAESNDLFQQVLIVSAQTIARENRSEQVIRACQGFKILGISDEMHHDAAETRFRFWQALNPDLLIGLTATPGRSDGIGLDALYQEITVAVPMLDLIADGYLARLVGLRVETDTSLDNVSTRRGDLAENQLAEAIDQQERNAFIVDTYQRHCTGRTRTVVFCVNVEHATHLRDTFRARGIQAETILGETPKEERLAIYKRFRDGTLPVLTNCMVLTEGWDEPAVDCGILARPTKSQTLYIQMVGRLARTSKATGKTDALVIDVVDVTTRHSLKTLVSLAGTRSMIGPIADDDATGRSELSEEEVRKQGELIDLYEVAAQHRLVRERRAVEVNLFGESLLDWTPLQSGSWKGGYVASVAKGLWLALRPMATGFLPTLVESGTRISEREWTAPKTTPLFQRELDAETAISVAEARGSVILAGHAIQLQRTAPWKKKNIPPTPEQISLAERLRIRVGPGETKGSLSKKLDAALFVRVAGRIV